MSRRRVIDIFQDVTNPGVPLLFLLGTVVLAVFGNAVYDLLVALISPAWDLGAILRLAALSAGSLAALAAVVGALWLWYNARRRPPPVPIAPAQALERAYAGLVVFVSENPQASERAAIGHHLRGGELRQLWLIVSREAQGKAQGLITWLRAEAGGATVQLTQLALADAFEVSAAYEAVVNALETAEGLVDQLIVDITAGTKQMSAGAVLACREYGVPMQYVRAAYAEGKVVAEAPAQLMKVRL